MKISQTNKRKIMKIESKVKSVTSASPSPAILLRLRYIMKYENPPTRVGVTWKYLMQDPNDVE